MPYAFAVVTCSCNKNMKYQCHSHDDDEYLDDFICPHFRSSVLKKSKFGLLLGFDQLAGLYFNVICVGCGNERIYSYEAKTFGKKSQDYCFNCCRNTLSFHFTWDY